MFYLLLIGVLIWIAFLSPLKVTVAAFLGLMLVTSVIRVSARFIGGADVSFSEAVKAMVSSLVFVGIAFTVLLSFLAGSGVHQISGLPGVAVFGGFLIAYVSGFKLSLGLSFGASALVALISSAVSTAAFVLAKQML